MMYVSKTFNKKMLGQLLIALVILVGVSLFMSNIPNIAPLAPTEIVVVLNDSDTKFPNSPAIKYTVNICMFRKHLTKKC
jgi:hypothetical protein